MIVLAIDPGPVESGIVVWDGERVLRAETVSNPVFLYELPKIAPAQVFPAIEMVESFGMPVGREIFRTCVWIGRFMQAWRDPEAVRLVPRLEVKMHLCGSARAKDPNIRMAILDRFGGRTAARKGGCLFGVRGHAWSALALAITVRDQLRCTCSWSGGDVSGKP